MDCGICDDKLHIIDGRCACCTIIVSEVYDVCMRQLTSKAKLSYFLVATDSSSHAK